MISKKTNKEIKIKYTDKSKDQPELIPVFNAIKDLLVSYKKGSLELHGGEDGKIMLISKKPVEIGEKKYDDIWFASALIQKGYVGFYYMPIYMIKEIKDALPAELLKCLKGKSCFHIKRYDENIFSQIDQALLLGFNAFIKKGWI